MNQRYKFKDFFFFFKEMHLLIVHSTHGREKKNLLLSVKFKTEGARVSLGDLLPCMFFTWGLLKENLVLTFQVIYRRLLKVFHVSFSF